MFAEEIKKMINKVVEKIRNSSDDDTLSDDLRQFKILIYEDPDKIIAMLYYSYSSDEKCKKRYYYI